MLTRIRPEPMIVRGRSSHPLIMLVSVLRGTGYGGIPIVNQLVLNALGEAGRSPVVVALQDRPADLRGSSLRALASGGSRRAFLVNALRSSRAASGATVFVTHIGLAPVGLLVKWLCAGRLVVFLHGVEAWTPLKSVIALSMRFCDRIVVNSRFTYNRFVEAHPRLRPIEADVCPLPARPLGPDAPGSPDGSLPGRPRVLIVGRLWGRGLLKGQRQLIALWPSVTAEFPGAELCIVGDGEGAEELKRRAESSRVGESIRFTGAVSDSDLAAWYASSDVYAMPSRDEGFGLVFAEAMSHGLPCIASRFDAGSEVVVDGETGLLVDPDDSAELLGALRALLGDEQLRRRMGRAGKRRAEDLYSIESFNARIREILSDGGSGT